VAPAVDPRLGEYVTRGREHLTAGRLDEAQESYQKASGLAERDARVVEGLAEVALLRAEHTWWELTLGKYDQDQRVRLLRKLDTQVDDARKVVAASLEKADDEDVRQRLHVGEQRLNAMLVVALGLHGDIERAKAAMSARLGKHPQSKLIAEFVAAVGKPRPETEEEADAGTEAPSLAAASKPAASAPPKAGSPHYEFEHEPTAPPKSPGELELPPPHSDPPAP
jgi:hypothetical protein